MKKQPGIFGLKDLLVKQFSFENADSDSALKPLAAESRDRRRPPVGTRFINSVDPGEFDTDAIMSLEISSSKIVAMIGHLNPRKEIEILGFGVQLVSNSGKRESWNVVKTAAAIRSAVAEAVELSGTTHVKAVYTNYSGRLFVNRLTEVLIKEDIREEISQSDIEDLKDQMHLVIFPPGEETILIQPEQYTIDDLPGILNPVGMMGKRIEASFRAVAGEIPLIRNLQKCVSRADLHLTSVYPSALASAEAVLMEEEKEGSIAVIDIGASVTHIAVFENGIFVHAETLQIGGNNVTVDVQEFSGLTFDKAETLKKTYNSISPLHVNEEDTISIDLFMGRKKVKISARELAYVMEARVEELICFAYSKVLAALNGLKPDLGLVITGGGLALFPNIEKLFKELTGARCYVGRPDLYLAPDRKLTPGLFALAKSPVYATSIGLLQMGLNERYFS